MTLPFGDGSLKQGGHFLFNVWDRIGENVFANAVTNALAEIFRDDQSRFLARMPHSYYDAALTRKELEAEGISHVEIETQASSKPQLITLSLPSKRNMAAAKSLPRFRRMS